MTDKETLLAWADALDNYDRKKMSPKGSYGIWVSEIVVDALTEQLRDIAGRIVENPAAV